MVARIGWNKTNAASFPTLALRNPDTYLSINATALQTNELGKSVATTAGYKIVVTIAMTDRIELRYTWMVLYLAWLHVQSMNDAPTWEAKKVSQDTSEQKMIRFQMPNSISCSFICPCFFEHS